MKPLGRHGAGPRDRPRSSRARRASARPARRCRQPAVLRARVGARRWSRPAVLSNARLVSTRQAGDVEVWIRCADIEPSTLRLTEFRVPASRRQLNSGPIIRCSGVFDGNGPFHAPPACIGQKVRAGRPEVSPVRSPARRVQPRRGDPPNRPSAGPSGLRRPAARDSVRAALAPEESVPGRGGGERGAPRSAARSSVRPAR